MLIIPENDDFDAYFPPTDASQNFPQHAGSADDNRQ